MSHPAAGARFFFFQAEDGIRDIGVTGVQTCALPISARCARCAWATAGCCSSSAAPTSTRARASSRSCTASGRRPRQVCAPSSSPTPPAGWPPSTGSARRCSSATTSTSPPAPRWSAPPSSTSPTCTRPGCGRWPGSWTRRWPRASTRLCRGPTTRRRPRSGCCARSARTWWACRRRSRRSRPGPRGSRCWGCRWSPTPRPASPARSSTTWRCSPPGRQRPAGWASPSSSSSGGCRDGHFRGSGRREALVSGPVLLTGAVGRIGAVLRGGLPERGWAVRSLDVVPVPDPRPGEEHVVADVTDPAAMAEAVSGASAVVHLAGVSGESTWAAISHANIDGTHCVLEAARRAGVPRVVLASSNHATGFTPRPASGLLREDDGLARPDTFYGVSKVAVEALGALYADRYGLDVVCLRIGTAAPEPTTTRHLRSEEHTSELQSRQYLVCRLLLEKKK